MFGKETQRGTDDTLSFWFLLENYMEDLPRLYSNRSKIVMDSEENNGYYIIWSGNLVLTGPSYITLPLSVAANYAHYFLCKVHISNLDGEWMEYVAPGAHPIILMPQWTLPRLLKMFQDGSCGTLSSLLRAVKTCSTKYQSNGTSFGSDAGDRKVLGACFVMGALRRTSPGLRDTTLEIMVF